MIKIQNCMRAHSVCGLAGGRAYYQKVRERTLISWNVASIRSFCGAIIARTKAGFCGRALEKSRWARRDFNHCRSPSGVILESCWRTALRAVVALAISIVRLSCDDRVRSEVLLLTFCSNEALQDARSVKHITPLVRASAETLHLWFDPEYADAEKLPQGDNATDARSRRLDHRGSKHTYRLCTESLRVME